MISTMPSPYPERLSKPSSAKVRRTFTLEDVQKNVRMRSARRASVRSACCEALRAEQQVDTPHPHIVPGAKRPEQPENDAKEARPSFMESTEAVQNTTYERPLRHLSNNTLRRRDKKG
jgi:hypothetical protein